MYTCEKLSQQYPDNQADWHGCNAVGLYLGGTWFTSHLGSWLSVISVI